MKNPIILCLIIAITLSSCKPTSENEVEHNVSIPTAGNSWVLNNSEYQSSEVIKQDGIVNWSNQNDVIRTFFYVENPGEISLAIKSRVAISKSKIQISFNGQSKTMTISGTEFSNFHVGKFTIKTIGYHFIDIKGLTKEGNTFADISAILIQTKTPESIKYVKNDYYFGRRGSSDHLNYIIPDEVNKVEWFYSELLIPENQDVEGSYFMANGFNEGYFGIQVNSPTERRILFSIWSPYKTDNPDEIPEEYKIKLLKKGENVITNKFGNEGSGGQSYKIFNWKTNTDYKFLVGAKPSNDGYTDFSAYFFDPEVNEWNLIAQFRRPKTKTYLKNLYSFLENFIPDQGAIERKGFYKNQWVYDSSGWHEINKAIFTADNTARKESRLDYSGGTFESSAFYLRNCGFTNNNTKIGTELQRQKLSKEPKVDFRLLE